MTSSPFMSRYRSWLFPLFLFAATFIVYHPAWHGEFIWDEKCVPHEPKDFGYYSLSGLGQIWFHPSPGQYYPLTFTMCWLEYHLWGLNTLGFHLVNIFLHALNAMLLWIILRRLSVPGAWLAAALFAFHPVNVETAAWISERKNTLSGFFFLCSILAALKFWLPEETSAKKPDLESLNPVGTRFRASEADRQVGPTIAPGEAGGGSGVAPKRFKDWKFYWLAFALFVCALLSKTTTIPLPAVILLLVWWKRGKITWPDIRPGLLFLAAGVAMGLLTCHDEYNYGAHGKAFEFSLLDRCLLAGRNFWFYLGKLAWPHPLIFIYPRWKINPSSALDWLPLLVLVPACIFLWLARNRRWGRPIFVALAYYAGMLFLTLGFFNVFSFKYSFVADHFQYLASMGPFTLAAAAITLAFHRCARVASPMTGEQNPSGRSASPADQPLGSGAVAPCMAYAVFSLGLVAVLGILSWKQCHMYAREETLWRTTIAQNPGTFLAHNKLGDLLSQKGQMDAAIEQYQMSAALHPADAETYHILGNLLLQTGRAEEATAAFQESLNLQPDYATGYADLGNCYLQTHRPDAAIQYFQKALQLKPNLPMVCYNLGNAYIQKGQLDLAIQSWQNAVELNPAYPMSHNNLGNAFLMKGQVAQAIQQWEEALKYEPALVSAQVNLAWVLATCPQPWLRNGTVAVSLAERADELSHGENPIALRSLAAAYAETGHFSDAIATAQQALQMARGNPGLSASIESQLKVYQSGQPFRDTTLTAH